MHTSTVALLTSVLVSVPALSAPSSSAASAASAASASAAIAETAADSAAANVEPEAWPEADEEIQAAAEGSLDVCEAAALPLVLIPGIGDIAALVGEWACIIPAAGAVDYVAVHHGNRESFVWQPLLALSAAKLAGDVVTIPLLALGVGAVAGYAAVATAVVIASGTPAFVPVAVAGGLLVGYGAFEIVHVARDKVPELVFTALYGLTTRPFEDEAEAADARRHAIIKPPPPAPVAAFAMMATAANTDVDTQAAFFIPVAGPFVKAHARSAKVKERMRRLGTDVFHDPEKDLTIMDHTEDALGGTKAALQAGGQAAIVGGVVLTGAGAAHTLYVMSQGEEPWLVDPVGIVGVVGIGAGVGLLLTSKVPDVIRPVVLPAAYALAPNRSADVE
jgi:hypothetical protein